MDESEQETGMMAGMASAPAHFVEVCETLFGDVLDPDEIWAEVHKASPDAADVHVKRPLKAKRGALQPLAKRAAPEEEKKEKTFGQKVGIATNTAGALAGPAAVGLAISSRKEGGMFRTAARAAGRRAGVKPEPSPAPTLHPKQLKPGSLRHRAANAAGRGAKWLDTPKGKKARVIAGGLGGAMIGLQGLNWAGDAIAARELSKGHRGALVPVDKRWKSGAFDRQVKHLAGQTRQIWSGAGNSSLPSSPVPGAKTPPPLTRKARKEAYEANARHDMGNKAQAQGRDIGRMLTTTSGKVLTGGALVAGGAGVKNVVAPKRQYEYVPDYMMKRDTADIEVRGEFTKFDDDKRQAFGWASIVKVDGQPVVDRQGDYISIEDLEEAAYRYVHKSRIGGDMHKRNGEAPHHVSDMIESIVFTPEKIAKMGLPPTFPQGWWVGYQINDEDTWAEVRKRGRTGFSIHGRGVRKEMPLDELMGVP